MSKLNLTKTGDFLFRWIAPLLVLGCAGWFVFAMGAQNKPNRKRPPVRKSIPVEVVQAEHHLGTLDIVSRGVVIPHREVNLSARVAGEVVFKSDLLSPGQFVNKGDLLLRVDQTDYKLEVDRLKQELAKVDVDLNRIKVDQANAQRLLKINRNIAQLRKVDDSRINRLRSANAATDSEADAAQLSVLLANEKVTTTENQLRGFESQAKSLIASRELATIQLARAELDQARTEILAPFSGVVIANHVEQNSHIANGAMVATIEDTSMVEVRCNLRSEEMGFVYESAVNNKPASLEKPSTDSSSQANNPQSDAYRLPPLPVTIEYERAGHTFQWAGVLSRQDGLGVDQNTRTTPVRILIKKPIGNLPTENTNPTNRSGSQRALALVRGMFVKVKLHCQSKTPLMVIPESVLRPGKIVWVMRNEKLSMEPVRITRIENGKAFFDPSQSSLLKTDQIITSPVPSAREGLAVSLKSNKKGPNGKGKSKGDALDAPNKHYDSSSAKNNQNEEPNDQKGSRAKSGQKASQ